MKRIKYTIANWKMNGSKESVNVVKYIEKHLEKTNNKNSKIVVCPPYTLIYQLINLKKKISFGGQNCHHLAEGAYTGSISAPMLSSIGCQYVIIGHSEIRQYHNENSRILKLKIQLALKYRLNVIYCIGEKLSEIKKRNYILKKQIDSLPNIFNPKKIIVAYEPVWAIGTGKVPSLKDINDTHLKVRQLIAKKIGTKKSNQVSILYGGSVNQENARTILDLDQVDGALVGGASLNARKFSKIIDSY